MEQLEDQNKKKKQEYIKIYVVRLPRQGEKFFFIFFQRKTNGKTTKTPITKICNIISQKICLDRIKIGFVCIGDFGLRLINLLLLP